MCAASMIVRKDEFLNFGGFDEDYFMYAEDVDLCWRYWLYGKRVEYIPASTVYHKYSGTSGTDRHTPLKVFYITRNTLFDLTKNYEASHMPFPLFFLLLYHVLKVFFFLVKLDFRSVMLMFKAYGSFLTYLPETIAKRKIIQSKRKIKDSYLFDNAVIESFRSTLKEFLRQLKA